MIDKNDYIAEKFIYSLIFGNLLEKYEDQEWITNINTLTSIKIVLEEFVKHNHLSYDIKEKLYDILSASRSVRTDNYEERAYLINEIIMLINSQRQDESEKFYRYEASKRYGTDKWLEEKYSIDDFIPEIDDSIVYDFIILYTHNNCSKESFDNELANDFSKDSRKYYLSLNAILAENPSIFKDEKFLNRVFEVLGLINQEYPKEKRKNKSMMKYLSKIS